jgi:hypothetical protein
MLLPLAWLRGGLDRPDPADRTAFGPLVSTALQTTYSSALSSWAAPLLDIGPLGRGCRAELCKVRIPAIGPCALKAANASHWRLYGAEC